MEKVSIIGVDIAKSVFQAHGAGASGGVVFRKKINRTKLLEFFASLTPCTVATEACDGEHLASTAGFAKANEMSLKVAEIPVGSQASSANLDQASMRSLFELGRRRGASGEAWSGVSPDGVALVSDALTDMSENRGGQSSSIDGPQLPDKR